MSRVIGTSHEVDREMQVGVGKDHTRLFVARFERKQDGLRMEWKDWLRCCDKLAMLRSFVRMRRYSDSEDQSSQAREISASQIS